MKRFIVLFFAFVMIFTTVCFAEDTASIDTVTELEDATNENGDDTAGETPPADEDTFNLKAYLTEKILPIVAGVVTSFIALGTTIARIKSSVGTLNSSSGALASVREEVKSTLKDMAAELSNGLSRSDANMDETLKNVKNELTSGLEQIDKAISEIPEIKEDYNELKGTYKNLEEQIRLLMEALRLGFASMPEAVKSGNARRINIISDKINEVGGYEKQD